MTILKATATECWQLCHCTSKEETRHTQAFGRWAMTFGLLGVFLVLFGGFVTRKGFTKSKDDDHSKMQYTGPIMMIVGGGSLVMCLLMTAFIPCIIYHKRKEVAKNPLAEKFIGDSFPPVVELVDWDNVTPTRTEYSDAQSLEIRITEIESETELDPSFNNNDKDTLTKESET